MEKGRQEFFHYCSMLAWQLTWHLTFLYIFYFFILLFFFPFPWLAVDIAFDIMFYPADTYSRTSPSFSSRQKKISYHCQMSILYVPGSTYLDLDFFSYVFFFTRTVLFSGYVARTWLYQCVCICIYTFFFYIFLVARTRI